jgi:plastocyanin
MMVTLDGRQPWLKLSLGTESDDTTLNGLPASVSGSMENRLMRWSAVESRPAAGALCLLCLLGISVSASAKHVPRRVEVKIEDLKYKPAEIEVGAGDTVVWMNDDDTDHLVKADDGSFSSGRIASGRSFEHKFDKPGQFIYHDDLHPRMRGTVIVKDQ